MFAIRGALLFMNQQSTFRLQGEQGRALVPSPVLILPPRTGATGPVRPPPAGFAQ